MVGIAPKTLLRWLQIQEFQKAYRQARREAYGQATARLQQGSGAAASTILRIMLDKDAPTSSRLRAAELILNHGAKAIEIEDIAPRVAALEEATQTPGQKR